MFAHDLMAVRKLGAVDLTSADAAAATAAAAAAAVAVAVVVVLTCVVPGADVSWSSAWPNSAQVFRRQWVLQAPL